MPTPKPGLAPKRSVPTIVCINDATEDLGVDFDRLIAALQKYLDKHFVPIWGTPAKLVKGKEPRSGTWTLLFTDDQDSVKAKRQGWLGLHHLEGNPVAKVFVKPLNDTGEKVSVAASHELAEMLVDPAISLWAIGPKGLLYAYEVCDAVEEEEFRVDGIPMCNFVYPAYFELFREPRSAQFDHRKILRRPFEILERGYATVLKNGKKVDITGSQAKKEHFKKENRTDHRGEYRGEFVSRKADRYGDIFVASQKEAAKKIERAQARDERVADDGDRRRERALQFARRCRNAANCP